MTRWRGLWRDAIALVGADGSSRRPLGLELSAAWWFAFISYITPVIYLIEQFQKIAGPYFLLRLAPLAATPGRRESPCRSLQSNVRRS